MMGKTRVKDEPHVRDQIGLTAASDGDINGLRRFASFVKNELDCLTLGTFPEEIELRLRSLSSELERVACFCDGYSSAEAALAKATLLFTEGEGFSTSSEGR